MKTTAWYRVVNGIKAGISWDRVNPDVDGWEEHPLFDSDQLRQAKVEVLREAADRLMNCGEEFGAKHLLILAEEIEKGEQ